MFDRQGKDKVMAASITGVSIPTLTGDLVSSQVRAHRRRQISREAGHALELLGHAIEYLADEYVHEGDSISAHDPRVEAVQLLMARNREVYFACPEALSLFERVFGWVHSHSGRANLVRRVGN